MRFLLLILLFCLFSVNLSLSSFSQEQGPVAGTYFTLPQIKKATSNQKVAEALSTCQRETGTKLANEPNITKEVFEKTADYCLMEKIGMLSPQDREQIKKELEDNKVENPNAMEYQSDAAYLQLKDYLKNRLNEQLYGKSLADDLNRPGKFVGHEVFYKLYKDQLEQNILTYTSYFCLNLDSQSRIAEDIATRKATREANLLNLTKSDDKGNNLGKIHFLSCLTNINQICSDLSGNTTEYTKNMACTLMREISLIRDALLALRNIDKNFVQAEKLTGTTIRTNDFTANYAYGKNPNEKGIDDLTNISTNELMNKAGLNQALLSKAQQYEQLCLKQQSAECQKLTYSNADYQQYVEVKNDFNAKTALKFNEIKMMNKEQIDKLLMEQGRTQAEIANIYNLIKTDPQNRNLQQIVADRYRSEREGIIKLIGEKYSKFSLNNGPNEAYRSNASNAPQTPVQADALKENIKMELLDKPEALKQAMLYNNIVTGYLTTNKGTSNTAPAFLELADSAMAAGTNSQTLGPDFFNKLQNETRKNLKATTGQDGTISNTQLEVETINNSILGNYAKPPQTPPGNQVAPTTPPTR